MACTKCKKNPCGACTCKGCLDIVYPKCILTESAYLCIGVSSGVTGSVLFGAIDAAICALQDSSGSASADITIIQEDITTINNSITIINNNVSNITDIVDILVDDVDNIYDVLIDATGCLYDATGGCEIENLSLEITTIQGDITTINTTILSLQDESFKTLGDGGNMENGQPVPAVTAAVTLQALGRLRRHSENYTEVNFIGNVEVDGLGAGILFTLPTGYRPSVLLRYSVAGTSSTSTDTYTGYVQVATTGVITLFVQPTVATSDTNFQLNWNIFVPTD
jgi:hypothetical protein